MPHYFVRASVNLWTHNWSCEPSHTMQFVPCNVAEVQNDPTTASLPALLCTMLHHLSALLPHPWHTLRIRGKHFWTSDLATSALASSRHVTSSTSLVDCSTTGIFLRSLSTSWVIDDVCLSMVSVNWVYLWLPVEWVVMVHSLQIACSHVSQ